MLYLVGVGRPANARLLRFSGRRFLILFASIILRRVVVCGHETRVRTRSPGESGGSFRRTTVHSVSHAFAQPPRTVRRSTSTLYSVVDETRESLVQVSAHATVLQGSRAGNLDAQGGKDTASRQVSHLLGFAGALDALPRRREHESASGGLIGEDIAHESQAPVPKLNGGCRLDLSDVELEESQGALIRHSMGSDVSSRQLERRILPAENSRPGRSARFCWVRLRIDAFVDAGDEHSRLRKNRLYDSGQIVIGRSESRRLVLFCRTQNWTSNFRARLEVGKRTLNLPFLAQTNSRPLRLWWRRCATSGSVPWLACTASGRDWRHDPGFRRKRSSERAPAADSSPMRRESLQPPR